jgi:tRNA (Thr-GGU) A37 N-methylase
MTTPHEEDDVHATLETLRAAVSRETAAKMSERRGRIKAERELREAKLRLLALTHDAGVGGRRRDGDEDAPREEVSRVHGGHGGESSPAERRASVPANADRADDANEVELYPLRPIGRFRSCFSRRNGTPRQPQLVPLARGRLTLRRHVPPAALEGLEQFSHVWIIYVFHENTDLHVAVGAGDASTRSISGDASPDGARLRSQRSTTSRAKVRVPRLNGERRGVFATRTPHRPLPIGLSLVEIKHVDHEKGFLEVGGADLVDGTPVLDIKPYLPFCEALTKDGAARVFAPDWVDFTSNDSSEPLTIVSVEFASGAFEELSEVWERRGAEKSLYASSAEFCAFCEQALSFDIRSAHKRLARGGGHVEIKDERTSGVVETSAASYNGSEPEPAGKWEVVLDGVSVRYDIRESRVVVRGGCVERRRAS